MSGLKDRLQRLKKSDTDAAPKKETPSLGLGWDRIGARMETNEWGSFILRERRYLLQHRHGHYSLALLDSLCAAELKALSEGTERLERSRLLFFDTETTGLGVGAGNVPFMIGIGYYLSDEFVVQQLFIRNPGEELAMLHYLQEKLEGSSHLVSYNGRTFDWPIMKNRYVLNRLQPLDDRWTHLDFLYPSRSLWRNTLPSCRLSKVEEGRLGFTREDDVPGSLAPTLYFQYLAEGDPALIEGVFVHNEHDILSLAGLAIHFGRMLQGQVSLQGMSAEELFRTGTWLARMGRAEQSELAFELLQQNHRNIGLHHLMLAQHYKKLGDFEQAASIWLSYVEQKRTSPAVLLEPYVELAMYYEHKAKDLPLALLYAEEAYEQGWRRKQLTRKDNKWKEACEDLTRRIERIKGKMSGAGTKGKAKSKLPKNNKPETASLYERTLL